jgi:hypothetical protein
MNRTLFHLALGSAVVTTALGAGFAVRSDRAAYKPRTAVCKIKEDEAKTVSPAARISTKYRDGVCLIVGTYSFTGPDGRPLRYVTPDSNGLPAFEDEDALNVSFKGTGDVYQLEFTYTGFVVENGKILTTRRAAEPWFGDPEARQIMNVGGKPRLEKLTAYFPASKKPFTLTVDKISTESNLALCTFNPEGENIPVLPLADSLAADPSGQAVVLMGFPTGVDGILARTNSGTGDSPKPEPAGPAGQAASLAEGGSLLPEVSTGTVSRLVAGRLTHDAPTAESGAGSPLFGPDGTVIGVCEVLPPEGPMDCSVAGLNLAISLQEVRAFLDGKSTKTVVVETTRKR